MLHAPPEVEVVIEVPRGSFVKRDWHGRVVFVSPLPCPYNYGSVPTHLGLEGDLLDAIVLGPRLALGTRTRVRAWAAVTLTDRGLSDDKLVCSRDPPSVAEIERVRRFFGCYARCKGLLNRLRRRPGRNACEGLIGAAAAPPPPAPPRPGLDGLAGAVLNRIDAPGRGSATRRGRPPRRAPAPSPAAAAVRLKSRAPG